MTDIAAIEARHKRWDDGPDENGEPFLICSRDEEIWPCDTRQALDSLRDMTADRDSWYEECEQARDMALAQKARADASEIDSERMTRRALDAEAGLLQVATEAGEDTSGIDHPDQLVSPSVSEFALSAVRNLRADYNEALDEAGSVSNSLRAAEARAKALKASPLREGTLDYEAGWDDALDYALAALAEPTEAER